MTSRWRFPAVPESVADARNALRTLGHESGAEEVVLDAIALCVSEAVTNVVVHAYRHGPVGDVWVTAWKPDGDHRRGRRHRYGALHAVRSHPGAIASSGAARG